MSGIEAAGEDLVREMEAAMARRIGQVERDNERLRRRVALLQVAAGVVLAAAALSVVFTVARGQPGYVADAVQARSFVLKGEDGSVRAVLGVTGQGVTRLVMQDRNGQARARLTLLPDGSPGLTFADRDGRARVVLGLLPDQSTNLVFADRERRTRAVLGLGSDDAMSLVFADPAGDTRLGLTVGPDGTPDFSLNERGAAPAPDPVPAEAAAPDSLQPAQPPAP
jgi:hypothetical protein